MVSVSSELEKDRKRRSRRVHERSRVALFDVFRHSFSKQVDQSGNSQTVAGSDVNRSNARRVGVSEEVLRSHVKAHLETLMNTVRLDAVSDLENYPHVAKSVLNYGFQDMSNVTHREMIGQDISRSIKKSLQDFEPRLVKGSIEVKIRVEKDDVSQRLGLQVMAELIADPADIPVDYEASVDVGSGKVVLQHQGK